MKTTDIYQTLEDRQNDEEVEDHGPYFCSERYANGILKKVQKSRGWVRVIISGIRDLRMPDGGAILFTARKGISFVKRPTTKIHLCFMIW